MLVLIVCEEQPTTAALSEVLRCGGHACITSASLERTRAILRQATPELIITTTEGDHLSALLTAAPDEVPFVVLGRTGLPELTGTSHRSIQVAAVDGNGQILAAVESLVAGGAKDRSG